MESDTLDLLDQQLVHALQLNARAPFSRIAEVLGVSDQTVARRFTRLRGERRLRVLGLTDPEALGETRWLVRVRCTPDASAAVAEALTRREDTTWVSLTSGGTEISCMTRSHPEADEHSLLLQRLPRTPSVVGVTAHCVIHTFFGGELSMVTKYGALDAGQVTALRLPRPGRPTGPVPVLDDADRRLLDVLAVDGRAGLAELAAATGWSQSTVRRRMDELTDRGVLYFDLDSDWRMFGIRTCTMLWLSVDPSRLAATGAALAEHHEVAYACATTGPTNLHAVVLTTDVRALYTYLTERIAALPGIGRMESAPIMRNIKGPGPLPTVPQAGRRR
ncbi:Lrp/AsnC family transcriptional regulator [Kitasatospora sp. NBC_01539]|uniref:Lrp/AsnC family transcriptional regulator n=1 Tax=Kitasatospora sp. NBC_01539 TaxID=2903577 RepID=UPI0038602D32